jgi:SAM-dependent methyltransferase
MNAHADGTVPRPVPNSARRGVSDRLRQIRYHAALAYYRLWRAAGGPDYLEEITYWEGILSQRPSSLFDRRVREAAFPPELRYCAAELQRDSRQLPRLLELGSGPVSLLASGIDDGLFTVVAVDPLARPYRYLLKYYGVTYPIQPRPGRGETLLKQFLPASFDIAYSSNALDHTISPRRCLEQMCQVVRPRGFLLLEGFVREGTHGNWSGLHQHDLLTEHGSLTHLDRAGRQTNLTADLPLTCVSERVCQFKDRGIEAFGYEVSADMPPDPPWNYHDWYTLLLCRL